MALEVLKNRSEVAAARHEMRSQGIDCVDHGIKRLLKRWRIFPGVMLGDPVKSWDVLKTVKFLSERVPCEAPLLDLGAYASEILPVLHRLGFNNLTGIDLNTRLADMPHGDKIHYMIEDFYTTSFYKASFDAVSAISVIEHGLDTMKLLAEVSRLLKPGGYFVASVDYWPEKIDTCGIKAFGMDWTIFSRGDLALLVERAHEYGLEPCGDLDYDAEDPTVNWMGREYTFAWLALRKTGEAT